LDLFVWFHLESLVYSFPLLDIESRRNGIVAGFYPVRNTSRICDRLLVAMRHGTEACIQAGGGRMDHLL
jgi:hypothetical protein